MDRQWRLASGPDTDPREQKMMKRPDPHRIQKRPMASARGDITIAPSRSDGLREWTLFENGELNLDTVHRLVESAESVTEGQPYQQGDKARFLGSTILTIGLSQPPLTDAVDADLVALFADRLQSDPRIERVLSDRVYRELSRLLGPDTPAGFDGQTTTRIQGKKVRIVTDFEATLDRVGRHTGS